MAKKGTALRQAKFHTEINVPLCHLRYKVPRRKAGREEKIQRQAGPKRSFVDIYIIPLYRKTVTPTKNAVLTAPEGITLSTAPLAEGAWTALLHFK
jgi:hypothetical protein